MPDHKPIAAPDRLPRIVGVRWDEREADLRAVRGQVFIVEQGIAPHEEWDSHDATCDHLLALAPDGSAVGTARLFDSGRIGRVAVLAAWRGQGVGRALLRSALDRAVQRGSPDICLDAQVQAIPFYAALGFVAEGAIFLDAGIPHQRMVYPARQVNASV